MVTTYGVSTNYQWCVAISTAQSSGPSGDILYLLCESVSGGFRSKAKISKYSGGSSFSNRNGKRDDSVSLKNCLVVKYSTYTQTESFNAILLFFKQFTKTSQSPAYLFIKNWNDNDYVAIGADAGLTASTDYMKGYPTAVNWKLEKNYYVFDTITFEECLN